MDEAAQDSKQGADPASPASLRHTLATLGGYLRPHRLAIGGGCLLLLAAGLIGLAQPLAAKLVLDRLAAGDSLALALVILTALVVVGALALAAGNFLVMRTAEAVVLAGRRNLLRHILRLTMAGMRRQAPGDLLARVTADTTLLRQIATQAVVQALVGLVMLVGALVLMAVIDAAMFVTTLAVMLLLAAAVGMTMPLIRRASRAAQQSVGEMGSALERVLGAFTTVKSSGTESREMQRVSSAARGAYEQGVVLAWWSSVAGTMSGLAIQLAFLVVLGVGGARVVSGAIPVSTLVAFLLYIVYLTQPVSQLVNAGTLFQAGRAAVQRIGEVTGLPTEPVDPDRPAAASRRGTSGPARPAALAFEDVWFTYPGQPAPAVRGFSLVVPAGGVTALVGPSGSGKTTLLNLIERFYDPCRGRILLDGQDISSWPLAQLRADIGYVEQDTPVMAGTLRENLAYSAPGASDQELYQALAVTRLQPLLKRLDGDLDAEIQHRGTSLSGGERQRVAIARALLRRPRLLLLDEATSQLDAVNEEALREAVAEVASRTTVVVVAHRLSTVRSADRIAVIEGARLRTVGSHEELVGRDELYARLAAGAPVG